MRKKVTFLPAQPRRVKDAPCPRQGRSNARRRGEPFLPARPRLPRQALFPWGYVEGLNEARTPLADFFRILLVVFRIDDVQSGRAAGRQQLFIGTDHGQAEWLELQRQG